MNTANYPEFKIFTGNAHKELADELALKLGKTLGKADIAAFSDGEISCTIKESVRGVDCFVFQTIAPEVNKSLMELLIIIDALKRASAGRINAVMPYYAYARQDRKARPRDPITAKLVGDLLTAAGVDRIITMDLHADQIQGYFNFPVDHLRGQKFLLDYLIKKNLDDIVLVSPDHGSVKRTRDMAKRLDVPIAIVDKRRPKDNVSEVMNIIGDIEGKNAILVDDMIDTAGTITNAANAIKDLGAKSVFACATHGVLSGEAIKRIESSAIEELILLNTLPVPEEKRISKIVVISTATVFADAIRRVHFNNSISEIAD